MTIPMSDGTPSGTLDVTTHFFEFIPEDEIKSPNPTVLAAHEIVPFRNYYILLTTSYGLYRYNIFDVVRCTGFHNQTPLVEFLSKGSLFSNLTGEKVSEYHVSGAMADVLRQLNISINTYSLAPCWDERLPYYGLFVERGDIADRATAQKAAAKFGTPAVRIERGICVQAAKFTLGADSLADFDARRLERLGPQATGANGRVDGAVQASVAGVGSEAARDASGGRGDFRLAATRSGARVLCHLQWHRARAPLRVAANRSTLDPFPWRPGQLRSRLRFPENFTFNLDGQLEILVGDTAGGMRLQLHPKLAPGDREIGVVIRRFAEKRDRVRHHQRRPPTVGRVLAADPAVFERPGGQAQLREAGGHFGAGVCFFFRHDENLGKV